mgnify:CR=1 FL=1
MATWRKTVREAEALQAAVVALAEAEAQLAGAPPTVKREPAAAVGPAAVPAGPVKPEDITGAIQRNVAFAHGLEAAGQFSIPELRQALEDHLQVVRDVLRERVDLTQEQADELRMIELGLVAELGAIDQAGAKASREERERALADWRASVKAATDAEREKAEKDAAEMAKAHPILRRIKLVFVADAREVKNKTDLAAFSVGTMIRQFERLPRALSEAGAGLTNLWDVLAAKRKGGVGAPGTLALVAAGAQVAVTALGALGRALFAHRKSIEEQAAANVEAARSAREAQRGVEGLAETFLGLSVRARGENVTLLQRQAGTIADFLANALIRGVRVSSTGDRDDPFWGGIPTRLGGVAGVPAERMTEFLTRLNDLMRLLTAGGGRPGIDFSLRTFLEEIGGLPLFRFTPTGGQVPLTNLADQFEVIAGLINELLPGLQARRIGTREEQEAAIALGARIGPDVGSMANRLLGFFDLVADLVAGRGLPLSEQLRRARVGFELGDVGQAGQAGVLSALLDQFEASGDATEAELDELRVELHRLRAETGEEAQAPGSVAFRSMTQITERTANVLQGELATIRAVLMNHMPRQTAVQEGQLPRIGDLLERMAGGDPDRALGTATSREFAAAGMPR